MNDWISKTLVTLLATGAVASSAPVKALDIKGISSMHPIAAVPAAVAVKKGMLEVSLESGAAILISDWPVWLPAGPHKGIASAFRSLHPAGPADRIELRQTSEASPYLIVMSGARAGYEVLEGWTLGWNEGKWILRNGGTWHDLVQGKTPLQVATSSGTWCMVLLETREPIPPGREVVQEFEPQADLIVLRKDTQRCYRPAKS